MRNTRLAYALIATLCMLLGVANFATAQGTASSRRDADSQPSGTNVALIDINKVFEQHATFQERFKALGEKFKTLEKSAKSQQGDLVKMKDALDAFAPGTPQYKEKEAELAKGESELRVQVGLEQKALAEEEAKIYYETYREIEKVTADFAARNNIGLVLRNMQAEMKPEDPNSVRLGLSRMVIYQSRLDITNQIITQINRDAGKATPISKGSRATKGDGPEVGTAPKGTKAR